MIKLAVCGFLALDCLIYGPGSIGWPLSLTLGVGALVACFTD
jgi:hypothetical protein